jgi:acetylornithine deacetylase/succinyl-diaminopimelate desuccinylase-like protein
MQVVFGVRGVTDVEMTVYGPRRPLHSGHYGNWAPNPIVMLAELVTSMRDSNGRIRIAHFLDDVTPPTAAERRALALVPPVDSALRAELQLGRTEGGGAPLVERIMLPALNLRGFQGGAVGAGAANAIPTEARASIDFRLVPRQTPERIRELVEAHARAKGFYVVHEEPTADVRRQHAKVVRMEWGASYPAARTPLNAPYARAVLRVVEESVGAPVIRLPTLGGSLPIYLFEDVLKTPLIVLPIVNHDNNQHAANENVRLQNLWDGIEVFAALFAGLR